MTESAGSLPLRIVVADDNKDVRETLVVALHLLGHDVQAAASGLDALRQLESWQPDLALIDVSMPGMSGYEVASAARLRHWGSTVKLVAMTGLGSASDLKHALEAGFDHHVVKPIDLQGLRMLLAGVSARGLSGETRAR